MTSRCTRARARLSASKALRTDGMRGRSIFLRQQVPVDCENPVDHALLGELPKRPPAAFLAEPHAESWIVNQPKQGVGNWNGLPRGNKEAVLSVADHLPASPDIGQHEGLPHRRRLNRRPRKALPVR